MAKLILHATSLAQWHALINEAQALAKHELGEDIESYVVYLLMRFTQNIDVAQSVIALDFLEGVALEGRQQYDKLQEVGDKCLLMSGLFPERARSRRVSPGYYIDMGQTAYSSLTAISSVDTAELFALLSERFPVICAILHNMRDIGHAATVVKQTDKPNDIDIFGNKSH